MTEYRIMKGRFGKPWKLVEGRYLSHGIRVLTERRGRWQTTFQHGEYRTKDEAQRALAELTKENA